MTEFRMCAAVSQDSIRPLFRTDWAKGEISKIWGSYLARNFIKKFKVRKTGDTEKRTFNLHDFRCFFVVLNIY